MWKYKIGSIYKKGKTEIWFDALIVKNSWLHHSLHASPIKLCGSYINLARLVLYQFKLIKNVLKCMC